MLKANEGSFIKSEEYYEEHFMMLKIRRWLYVGTLCIVVSILCVAFAKLLNLLSVPVGIVVWTTIVVFCLRGVVNKLEGYGISRLPGTAIAYALMLLFLVLLVCLLFSPVFGLGEQFLALVENIPEHFSALSGRWNDFYNEYAYIFQDEQVKQWGNDALASLGSWVSSFISSSADSVISLGSGLINTFMVIGLSLVVAFWVLMELPALGREIRRLFGPAHKQELDIWYFTATRIMGGYIKGTLLQCFLIGLASGIGYFIMGIPSAAALGLITGLLNIIPVVGPWLGGATAGIVGIFVSPFIALIALVYAIVVQHIIYTFVTPKIMGDSVDIHPALIIFAMMCGLSFGAAINGLMGSLLGMLASIPLVAMAKSLFVYYFEKNTGRSIVAPDGVIFKGGSSTYSSCEATDIQKDAKHFYSYRKTDEDDAIPVGTDTHNADS